MAPGQNDRHQPSSAASGAGSATSMTGLHSAFQYEKASMMASARIMRRAVGVVSPAVSSWVSPASSTAGRNRSSPAANANSRVTPAGVRVAWAPSMRNTG